MDQMKHVLIGADHAGFPLKEQLTEDLRQRGYQVTDYGTANHDSVDYPDFAGHVCRDINANTCGILICGTGIGMSMAANRHRHVRAALCTSAQMARLSRQHNDANVLCLGARTTQPSTALEIVLAWLDAEFTGEPRHRQRIKKFA